MWKILLEEFVGDLKAQKMRTFLTTFAMTWGTIAVVLLLSFGEGLKRAVVDGLVNAGDQIYMVYGGETSKVFEGLPRPGGARPSGRVDGSKGRISYQFGDSFPVSPSVCRTHWS